MREPTPELVARRRELVEATMTRVRAIEKQHGPTREALEAIKNELLALARERDVFLTTEFKPAKRGTFKDFVAYRLNEEDGTGRAMYLSLALPGKSSPPHNHKNWAVLVGLVGAEENRLYEVDESGSFRQRDAIMVGQGVGDEPVWQLRFYERPLEDQVDREQFDPGTGKREMFPPNPNVKPS
ncbi:hypothetical protein FYA99_02720 [Bordetella parapertussis]|uniref:Cysteine dioxygenase n=2 Tax=Bordetella parapertussis TaxID=519 RepID=Q7WBZ9_BORPA|nr:hypothetical protein [Bordetella parapertussis]AOB37866.1 hypothetical protein BBB43_02640 [Bordetella parapertussis]AUL41836.1 hypothetical protein BTL54_02700 [Bordetella parapertussis]AWP61750.1 hypothetical protein B7P06_02710 [Bordetella parapertussis]AWP69247.1 hypothetical protein B7O99_02705 [Bordetella parapertussis]AWP87839.1 hypothetical protein B7P05_02700 [Bordetella parapertussis]